MKKRKSWGAIGVPLETKEKIRRLAERHSMTQWQVLEELLQVKEPSPASLPKSPKVTRDN